MMLEDIRDLMKFVTEHVSIEYINRRLTIEVGANVGDIIAVDSALVSSPDLFETMHKKFSCRRYYFIHRYDQIVSGGSDWLSMDDRVNLVDLSKNNWRSVFFEDLPKFDAIAYNFKNGLVVSCDSQRWFAICLMQCDVALIFTLGENASDFDELKGLGYPRDVALNLLRTCLDEDSVARIASKLP